MAKILFVDDEIELTKIASYILAQRGHRVDIAHNGADAIKILTNHDIAIIDAYMSPISGEELISEIRQNNRRIKIVLTSGDIYRLDSILGCDLVVPKPISYHKLSDIITNLCHAKDASLQTIQTAAFIPR